MHEIISPHEITGYHPFTFYYKYIGAGIDTGIGPYIGCQNYCIHDIISLDHISHTPILNNDNSITLPLHRQLSKTTHPPHPHSTPLTPPLTPPPPPRRQLSKNVHTFFGVNKDTRGEQQHKWRSRSLRLTGHQPSISPSGVDSALDYVDATTPITMTPLSITGRPVKASVSFNQPLKPPPQTGQSRHSYGPSVSFSVADPHSVSIQPSYTSIQFVFNPPYQPLITTITPYNMYSHPL